MKNREKRVTRAAVLMLLCTVFLLTACMKKDEEYKKDIDTKEIATALSKKTPIESTWINEDQYFIEEYVYLPEYVKESYVYYAQNTNNIDEFGIFEVEEGKAGAVRSLLTQGYLQKKYSENREWYDTYMPAETYKLRDAEVRVFGNCVVYAVLSTENRKAFFTECEKLLKDTN